VEELKELGLTDANVDEHCYVTATIPSNLPGNKKVPVIGLIAHVDTSPEVSDENVDPQIIKNYQGEDIVLPKDNNIVIKVSECAALKECIGHTLITTDGTTLLGSDNKAGVAEIMTMAETLMKNPGILHGTVKIGFTPDEEVGNGAKYFDIKKFGADYAYTVDGELPGELNKETFSANTAIIRVHGRDIHPGAAKNIMVNSVRIIADIIQMMPPNMAPETTEGYEPYIHPYVLEGGVHLSTIKILLRDFKTEGLDAQKKILEHIIEVAKINHPKAKIELEIIEMYRNMREKLDECPIVLDTLWEAAKRAGTNPFWNPIRGGTDGSRLTADGLPTPNIYTGGQNFHSKTEWLSVDAMEKTVETLVNLVQVWVEKS
jgi:tripeptide aminopeptidase